MDFTIIIPSFNQGKYLDACIQSIVATRSKDCSVEIIILDSESIDSTPMVLNKWENHIDKIIVEKDTGQTSAINKGFELARGDYVNWLGCDDRLKRHSLSAIKSEFVSNDEIQVVSGYSDVYRNGQYLCSQRTIPPSSHIDIRLAFPRIVQPSTFWRKSAFQALSPLNEDLHYVMDLDIWLRFIMANSPSTICFMNTVLAEINIHNACKSFRDAHMFEAEILLCIERVFLEYCRTTSSQHQEAAAVGVRDSDAILNSIFSYRCIYNQLLALKSLDLSNPTIRSLQSPISWIRFLLHVRPSIKTLVKSSQYSIDSRRHNQET